MPNHRLVFLQDYPPWPVLVGGGRAAEAEAQEKQVKYTVNNKTLKMINL